MAPTTTTLLVAQVKFAVAQSEILPPLGVLAPARTGLVIAPATIMTLAILSKTFIGISCPFRIGSYSF
jgi:hypothetical protein